MKGIRPKIGREILNPKTGGIVDTGRPPTYVRKREQNPELYNHVSRELSEIVHMLSDPVYRFVELVTGHTNSKDTEFWDAPRPGSHEMESLVRKKILEPITPSLDGFNLTEALSSDLNDIEKKINVFKSLMEHAGQRMDESMFERMRDPKSEDRKVLEAVIKAILASVQLVTDEEQEQQEQPGQPEGMSRNVPNDPADVFIDEMKSNWSAEERPKTLREFDQSGNFNQLNTGARFWRGLDNPRVTLFRLLGSRSSLSDTQLKAWAILYGIPLEALNGKDDGVRREEMLDTFLHLESMGIVLLKPIFKSALSTALDDVHLQCKHPEVAGIDLMTSPDVSNMFALLVAKHIAQTRVSNSAYARKDNRVAVWNSIKDLRLRFRNVGYIGSRLVFTNSFSSTSEKSRINRRLRTERLLQNNNQYFSDLH